MTARLALRMLEEREAHEAARFYRVNEEHLLPSSPRIPPDFYTEDFWRKRIRSSNEEFQADQSVRFFLFEPARPETILGSLGLTLISRGPFQACKLGYALGHNYIGKGLMTEALRVGITYAFGTLNLHRIEAGYLTDNHRSGAVLERLGFEKLGIAREYLLIAGRWRDHVLTSLTNSTWLER